MSAKFQSQNKTAAAEFLDGISRCLSEVLRKHGIAESVIRLAAPAASERVREDLAGIIVYIPKGNRDKQEEIRKKIFDEFNGTNVRPLALKYKLTVQSIYKLLREERARRRIHRDAAKQ